MQHSNSEDGWMQISSRAEAGLLKLLDALPLTQETEQTTLERLWSTHLERWEQLHVSYGVTKGTREVVLRSMDEDFKLFTWARNKRDPECGGWHEFGQMLDTGKHQFYYRWGVNRFGHEFYRFGQELFVHVKVGEWGGPWD